MRSATLTLFAAVSLLALTPLAAAQVPVPGATPQYTLLLQDVPGAFPELASNGTVQVPFTVVLTLSNVVCAAAVQVPITLTTTVSGAPTGFTALPEPSVINITISEGPHGAPPAGSPGGGRGDGAVKATIAGNTTNASIAVTLVATAPAPPSGANGCQGAGPISAATSEPATVFANTTAPPPPPEPTPVDEDTPGFTLLVALAAVGLAALTRRKRA